MPAGLFAATVPRVPSRARTRGCRLAVGGMLLGLALFASSCKDKASPPTEAAGGAPPWHLEPTAEAVPVPGMVWIPPGTLIAGTPPDRLPRVADEEMAGEQVVMGGFYIDTFPFPNEAGAIPKTHVTFGEASQLCERQGKRLCTELEWERACKGPENSMYESGDRYLPEVCKTGTSRTLTPTGMNAACKSGFGVADLHGSVWNWTASRWGRGAKDADLVTVRGGNGTPGELISRCANGRPIAQDKASSDVGFRCCKGDINEFEVVLSVTRGEPLRWQPPDRFLAPRIEKLIAKRPGEGAWDKSAESGPGRFVVERMWVWHPLGNEELLIGGGCGEEHPGATEKRWCGVLISRVRSKRPKPVAFVSSDRWQPTLGMAETARELFIYGGDDNGAFRKRVSYDWGRVGISDKQRKRRRKGQTRATYD